jgi:hypothetical protein
MPTTTTSPPGPRQERIDHRHQATVRNHGHASGALVSPMKFQPPRALAPAARAPTSFHRLRDPLVSGLVLDQRQGLGQRGRTGATASGIRTNAEELPDPRRVLAHPRFRLAASLLRLSRRRSRTPSRRRANTFSVQASFASRWRCTTATFIESTQGR